MTPTLRAFMHGLIDYAGLFPPARLSMHDAVTTFARHLDGGYSWMLGSFICPVGRLHELADFRAALALHAPVQVSVLGTAPSTGNDVMEVASRDADSVIQFEANGFARCAQLELKWPDSLVSSDMLRWYASRMSDAGCSFERLFFEIDRRDSWDRDVVRMVAALAAAGESFGFKIRTGGITPDLYPTAQQIAVVLATCRDANVPFKATAGLHHPIRHELPGEGLLQHGFVNVFGAAVLARETGLDQQELAEIIDHRKLSDFTFDSAALRWMQHAIGVEALADARAQLAFSYGSCSFDEPLEDLAAANLL